MQKFKNEIKLYKIINSQASLLKEWKRLEGRNCEAVGRVARKLSSTSIRIPLLHGAKVLIYFLIICALSSLISFFLIILLIILPKKKVMENMKFIINNNVLIL